MSKEYFIYVAGTVCAELANLVSEGAVRQKRKLLRGISRFGRNIEQDTILSLYRYNQKLGLNKENSLEIEKVCGNIGNILSFKSKLKSSSPDYRNSDLLSKLLTKYCETLKEEAKLINITSFFNTEDKSATQYAYQIKSENLISELAVAVLVKPITNGSTSIEYNGIGKLEPGLNAVIIIDNDLVVAQYDSLQTEAKILIYDLDSKSLKNTCSITGALSFDKIITHHLSDAASKSVGIAEQTSELSM